jgi:peroxiredoxin
MRSLLWVWLTLWLGAMAAPAAAQAVSAAAASSPQPPWLGLLRPRQGVFGVQVAEVFEDSGAAAAGLVAGDEILFIDDLPVTSVGELVMVVQRHGVGERVMVRVLRRGSEFTVAVTLGARVDDRELLHRRLVGKSAPAATLRGLDDDRVQDPSALRGRVAVLAFFSTRCDSCGDVVSRLARWSVDRRDAVVMAVTAAEPALVATYLSRATMAVPVAVAEEEDYEQYGLLGARADSAVAFVVIDRSGVVRMAAVIGADDDGQASATVEDVIASARQWLRAPRP